VISDRALCLATPSADAGDHGSSAPEGRQLTVLEAQGCPSALRRSLRQGGSVKVLTVPTPAAKTRRVHKHRFAYDYIHISSCSSPDVHRPWQWWLCCVGCSTCSLVWLLSLGLDTTSAVATERSAAHDCRQPERYIYIYIALRSAELSWTSKSSRNGSHVIHVDVCMSPVMHDDLAWVVWHRPSSYTTAQPVVYSMTSTCHTAFVVRWQRWHAALSFKSRDSAAIYIYSAAQLAARQCQHLHVPQ
jgi:hypothetical protein